MNIDKQTREQWREWLGKHGLPYNEVEGDMILDFMEWVIQSAVLEELNEIPKLKLYLYKGNAQWATEAINTGTYIRDRIKELQRELEK